MSSFQVGDHNVVILPSVLAIYGKDCHQFFDLPDEARPFDGNLEKLAGAWAGREDRMLKAARLHREGIVSKDLFIASVVVLRERNVISDSQEVILYQFIESCDCPPKVVRKKLENLGFSAIIKDLWFERLHPEMDKSLKILEKFLEQVRAEEVLKA